MTDRRTDGRKTEREKERKKGRKEGKKLELDKRANTKRKIESQKEKNALHNRIRCSEGDVNVLLIPTLLLFDLPKSSFAVTTSVWAHNPMKESLSRLVAQKSSQ